MAVSMLARNEKMVRPAVEIPGQMPEALNIIIKTKNLSVSYGEKAAIKKVSLAFPEHQVTALIGPSGCGKSTFLRSLNRMNDEIAGCRMSGGIFYKGADITLSCADVFEIRKHIGMVFQRPNPFAKSVFENVAFGPKHHGVKKKAILEEIVEESLKKAALWDEVKDRLHTSALALSGGQQQRLCIARALAMNPDVLLLDEPASALDPVSTGKIEELILELKKDYTVAIVTHNLQQAARISDKTAFFFMGALIEAGDTAKIFTKPENQKTRDYLSGFFG
ncbi:phosphate ABC transporter ATP-binding protein [Heyndrickxia coagulans]|uniref:Phosphate transport system ATP-binding protein n=2 Tax=Heyndrickxia coagulans TaxID=1398 RepID=A0A8B4BW54_HEYCO|nr:phosphate ABC transporter ATP-binding protein [Heyndrickxia coagulans]MDR4224794.1 phosphate ABC transporter ATP-binding protein [Heyndrickxia coagulans DSM 1 = ATCC 7050]QJE31364.1 phosphate ABC transporter ATP-binding protein [Heyndrickxia coagulans]QQS93312.1 phosphate ABC transporter ATP-binding protein [Heyndrickxia coagulans]SHF65474.1 phosphate transport system ATP-binding protein [Heyndrickxia coagulans DSM 1 = ATCC 7050]